MKTVVFALLAALLLVSVASAEICVEPAKTLPTEESAKVLISGGIYWPTSSDTGDLFDTVWLNVGLEYKVAQGRKIDHYAGVGWLHASGADFVVHTEAGTGTADSSLDVIPISYTQRWRPNPRSRFYAGGGLDLFITLASFTIVNGGVTTDDDTTDVIPGLHALGGYAFTDNIRLEARYTVLDKADVFDSLGTRLEENFDGLGVTLVAAF